MALATAALAAMAACKNLAPGPLRGNRSSAQMLSAAARPDIQVL
jgi:hypothetical protein